MMSAADMMKHGDPRRHYHLRILCCSLSDGMVLTIGSRMEGGGGASGKVAGEGGVNEERARGMRQQDADTRMLSTMLGTGQGFHYTERKSLQPI